jgi:prevent-host-death family protein
MASMSSTADGTETAPEAQVSVRELREHLADYLQKVRNGASFTVVSRGEPVARLIAPASKPTPASLYGVLKGQIWLAPDFDDEDPDMIASIEADPEP